MKRFYTLLSTALLTLSFFAAQTSQAQSFNSPVTISIPGQGSSHIPYEPNGSIYFTGNRSGGKAGNFYFRSQSNGSYLHSLVVFHGNSGTVESKGDFLMTAAKSGNSTWLFHTPDNGSGIMYLGHNNKGTTGWNWDYQFRQTHFYAKAASIGTGTLPAGYKLSVDGKIMAEEVTVQLSQTWPDYVFAPEYDLMSLSETEAFINENSHLPGLPSAAEVAAEGFDLAEMNRLLLEKIEELTLHTIEQQKLMQEQVETAEKLEREIAQLKSLIK